MDEETLQAWRRTRLEALANQLGGKAELGRKLGYEDGSFVGQMIKGLRPITEKTVRAAEAIDRRFRNWFAFLPPDQMPTPAEKYVNVLRDLEDIPPGRRARLLDEIQQAAEEAREAAAHLATRLPTEDLPLADEERATEHDERVTASLTDRGANGASGGKRNVKD